MSYKGALIVVFIHNSGQRPSWTLSARFQSVSGSLFESGRWWLWGKTWMAHRTDAGVSGILNETPTHTHTHLTDSSLAPFLSQGRWGELVPLESEPGHNKRGSRQERDLPNQRAASERPSLEARCDSCRALANSFKDRWTCDDSGSFPQMNWSAILLIPFQTAGLRWSQERWSWAGARGLRWSRWSRWRWDTDALRSSWCEETVESHRHCWDHSTGDHWANECTDLHRSHMPFDHGAVQGK